MKNQQTLSTDVFLISSHWRDHNNHLELTLFGISKNEEIIEIIITNYETVFFIPQEADLSSLGFFKNIKRKRVQLKSFQKEPVDCLYFNTQKSLYQARRILEDENFRSFEVDVDPVRRFLMERFINGAITISGEYHQKDHKKVFDNPIIKKLDSESISSPKLKISSLDIETGVASGRLYSIACDIKGRDDDSQIVFMLDETPNEGSKKYVSCATQKELLTKFFHWFKKEDPDIIIGWHVIGFDFQFLKSKCNEFRIPLDLSRNHLPVKMDQNHQGKWFIEIPGRAVLDGPTSLRGAFYNFDDFRLETVSQELLNKGKLIDSNQDKIDEIEDQFENNKPSLAEYNLMDCILVNEIFTKTDLIDLFINRVFISGMLLENVGRSTAAFDHYFLPRLHRNGFVAPSLKDVVPQDHAAGGYVMDPLPGFYKNILVLDFKSLYPSIIRTFKIDPLSLHMNHVAPVLLPTNYVFSRDHHILPECVEYLLKKRSEAKNNKNAHLSQAIKILMNSFYGVMGSFGCRFYHPQLPNAITKTGQWLLKESRSFIEKKGYQVIYGDTDSLFVKIDDDSDLQDSTGENLAADINHYWENRIKDDFELESYLEMEYEKCYYQFVLPYSRGNTTSGAKKRYAGLLHKNNSTEIEFIGLEAVRSDWTAIAKQFQNELYDRFFKQLELDNWIRDFVKQILAGNCDNQLVYKKRIRKKLDEYVKNVPPQIKAAKLLNNNNIKDIRYVITPDGPVPTELKPKKIDYQHYLDKQIEPIADSLLNLINKDFKKIVYPQQLKLYEDD